MTVLKVSVIKVQLQMARKSMNPYDLCSAAGISYQTYLRIFKIGTCKPATLGKLAKGLSVDVTEILADK